MAAALALGAEGVWCGSVWLTTNEAETSPVVKEKFLAATSADTRRSRSLTGKPARMLRTAWTDAWEVADAPAPLGMPLQSVLVADAQRRIQRVAHKAGSGARELATYFVGQVVGQMNEPKSTRRVVAEMVEELVATMERLDRLVAEE
jgi:NAD(P)H-dependent flavin oxidoreductase YrpB (nitropropane dioxygenase family)